MTEKEQRELASLLAKEEILIKENKDNKDIIEHAQERMVKLILSHDDLTLNDMIIIDDMVQKILS